MVQKKNSTQTEGTSTKTAELRRRHEAQVDQLDNDSSISEVTHNLVHEQIKQAFEPILGQSEQPCSLLANQIKL